MFNKIKKKKGFTLIEIIICIALISIIGAVSFVSISKYSKKTNEKFYSQFDDALEVYLSNHSDVYDNLSDNVEGAVITLNLLKNEGLISDNIIDPDTKKVIDYDNNYYVLSDAVLLSDEEEIEEGTDPCVGMVEITVLKSWETLKDKVDTNDVIYICPKDNKEESKTSDISELEERISKLENIVQRINMGQKNHVLLDINSEPSKLAYFPNNAENNEQGDYNDIWRIVVNQNNSNNFTLMYNQNIKTNYNNLFPKVSEIIESNSNALQATSKEVGKTGSDCANKNYITAYSISPVALGKYYSFDSNDGLGYIQGLYKAGNDYYSSLKKYDYSCYYLGNKIDDINNYVLSESSYSFLKNDSFKSYYFKGGYSYRLSLINENYGLDYISLLDLRENNPFKDDLYNNINDNFKSYMKKTSNSYRYGLISGTDTVIPTNDNSFNSTYLRTLTKQEVDKNKSWLSTFKIPLGIYIPDSYLISDISYVNNVVSNYKKTPKTLYYVYSTYGEIIYEKRNIVNANQSQTYEGNSSGDEWIGKDSSSYSLKNASYNPVIDLKNVNLITDINNYSNKYKTKRSSCTNDDLGTYECPYLLKIGSYFSDGTTN